MDWSFCRVHPDALDGAQSATPGQDGPLTQGRRPPAPPARYTGSPTAYAESPPTASYPAAMFPQTRAADSFAAGIRSSSGYDRRHDYHHERNGRNDYQNDRVPFPS
jgi:hypothetical protein